MNAINLYIFTRCTDISDFLLFEKKLSDREERLKQIKKDEIKTVELLVSILETNDADMEDMDNWFYSFSIPQISKEFDLLLIDRNRKVVNIELKGQDVDGDKIEKQLFQNRYYLSNLADEIISYTFVRVNDTEFKLYKYKEKLELELL